MPGVASKVSQAFASIPAKGLWRRLVLAIQAFVFRPGAAKKEAELQLQKAFAISTPSSSGGKGFSDFKMNTPDIFSAQLPLNHEELKAFWRSVCDGKPEAAQDEIQKHATRTEGATSYSTRIPLVHFEFQKGAGGAVRVLFFASEEIHGAKHVAFAYAEAEFQLAPEFRQWVEQVPRRFSVLWGLWSRQWSESRLRTQVLEQDLDLTSGASPVAQVLALIFGSMHKELQRLQAGSARETPCGFAG